MADFNLSASINVQMAPNAAKLLRDDANKALEGLSASPKINISLGSVDSYIERLFPRDGRSKAKMPISISVSNEQYFKDLFADRKIKVKLDFGQQSTSNIDQYTDSLSKLKKVLDSMGAEGKSTIQVLNDLSKAAINANAASASAKTKARGSKLSKEEAQVKKLIDRVSGLNTQANPGKFLPFAKEELAALIKDLGTIQELTKRFEGIGKKNSALGITKALESTHRAMADIDVLSQKLNREGLLNSKTEAQLKGVKDEVLGLLRTLDASNISAFGTELNRILSPAKSGFNELISDTKRYQGLIISLNKELRKNIETGAPDQTLNSLRERIRLTEELRSKGKSFNEIKADPTLQNVSGGIANQENINKALKQVRQSIKTVNSEIRNSAIYESEGGRASGLKDKVTAVILELDKFTSAQTKLNSPDSLSNINNALVEAKNKISNLVKDTKTFDTALQNLGSKKAFFDQEGLTAASAEIGKIRDELYRMVAAGAGINEIGSAFTTMSARVEKIGNDEQKIKRFTFALDRLKASLSFDTDNFLEDFSGVGDAIKKAQDKIDAASKKPGGFDEREVRSQLAADSLLIRSKDKINKLISDNREKFADNISQGGAGTVIQKAFVNGSAEYEKGLRSLNLTGADTGRVLKEISDNFESTFKHAKFEAEGGFFGSLSKAAGLAAKRLGAFLVVARGFYAIQNLFLDAGRSVLVLDTEFTKLEQIISKSSPSLEATERSMAKLSGTILNLGKEFGVATEEIAQSADTLAQADITGAKLEKLLEISTKARLGPSFESNIQITEAMISVINQFNVTAGEMEQIIGGISQVSAKYPVEAEGITKAIRRAGGAFAAAKAEGQSYQSSLADFVAGFTIVKSKTREADETLATSLRNIVNRLQKNNIQSFLREKFDVSLLDQQGQFIGFAQSIDLISKKVAELGLKSGDPRFAELVDKLAGQRQSSRLLPLLQNAGEFSKIIQEFNNGADSLDKDVSIAFKSIENKILRAKNAVIELFTELGRSEVVKTLVDGFTLFTQVLTGVARALNNVGGLIVALGLSIRAIPAISNISSIIGSYGKIGFLGRPEIRDTRALSSITGVRTAATGGKVPGAPSSRDTEPYYLAKGEYVVQSKAVQHYGTSFFDAINEGKINFAAKGTSGGNFTPEYGSALDDGIQPLIKAVKFGAKLLKDAFLGLKNAADSAPPLTGLERTLNLPSVQTAPKLTKDQRNSRRLEEAAEKAFEETFIRFDPAKSAQTQTKTKGSDRISLAEIQERAAAAAEKRKLDNLDTLASTSGSGRYQPSGQNPPVPFSPDKTRHQEAAENQDLLHELLTKAGINVDKKKLTQIASGGLQTGDSYNPKNPNAKGAFNFRNKSIGLKDQNDLSTLGHEFGHALEEELGPAVKKAIVANLPDSVRQKTIDRVEAASKGGRGTGYRDIIGNIRPETIISETFADAVQSLSTKKDRKGSAADNPDNVGFKQLEEALGKIGVTFKQDESTPGSRRFQKLASNRNRDDSGGKVLDISNLSGIGGNIDVDRLYSNTNGPPSGGGRKPPSGGRPPDGGGPPPPPPPDPPLNNLAKSATASSKSLASFGKSLLTNTTFLFGLGTAALSLVSLAGSSKEANDQIQKLVKAIGAATAAAILLSQASSLTKGSKFSRASRAQLAEDSKKIGFNSVGNAQGAFGPVAPTLSGQENLSKRQRKAARKAFAESGVSLGSSIPTAYVRPSRLQQVKNFASNAGSNIKGGLSDISSGIKNNLEGISIAAVAATAALVSFADSVIEAADKTIEESTSESETLEAIRKRRGAQVGKAVAGGAGGAVGGALLGAQLGGPQGALIGAAAGLILGLASQIGDLLENTAIGDAVNYAREILNQVGVVLGKNFDTLLNVVTLGGNNILKTLGFGGDSEEKDKLKTKTLLAGTNFNRFNKDLKSGGGLTPEVSKSFVDGAKKLSEVIGPITKEGVSKFDKEATDPQSERVKATAEKLKASLDTGTPAQKLALIRSAKESGIDIANLLKAIGVAYDPLTEVALDSAQKIEEVFLKMEDNFKRVSDKLSNFNANNEIIGNIASGVAGEGFNGSIPSSVFETLKGGGKVDGLGGQLVNQQLSQLGKVAPQIAKDVNTQITGVQAGANLKSVVASGSFRGVSGSIELSGQIQEVFAQSIKGAPKEVQSQLTTLFDNYLDTVNDDLNNSVVGTGVDTAKLSGVIDGFINTVNKGGIDLLQKYSESNAQFKSQLDGVLKKRIDFENKITDLLGKNIDNKKSIQEFRNQASGRSKDLTLAQAGDIDSERQANILRKTGLGGSATVSDIKNRFNDLTRQDPTGANPVIQDMKAGLMTALESIAGGTDVLSASIRDFEKATEEARKNTERLTGALLGTDEELLNTVKGVLAFEKVKGAKNQTEAFLAVNSLDQSSKAALGKRIGETEDSRLLFENKLGIAPNLTGSPQLNKVEGEIGKQSEANTVMAGINANLATQMNTLANAMVANKQTFEQFGMNVNNFGNIATQLSASLTNIPTSVAHTMTVAPIQISFTGTDGLNKLNDSSAALVTSVVNSAINKFASGLQSDNKGLVVNTVAAMNSAPQGKKA